MITDSDEDIKDKVAEANEFLKALEGGDLHIGAPFEGRTEAKIHDLKRQIAMGSQSWISAMPTQ